MNTRLLFLLFVLFFRASSAQAAYQYYYTDTLTSINNTYWRLNGAVTAASQGLSATTVNGGSLISLVAVPDGSTQYEVNTTLTLAANGGTYVHYLAASQDALTGPAAGGTFFSVELRNPLLNGISTLVIQKRENGLFTQLASTIVYCHTGMKIRSVLIANLIYVFVDGTYVTGYNFGTLPPAFVNGRPGVGAFSTPSGNSITPLQLGPMDWITPNPIERLTLGSSVFPNRVELQWQGVSDDATGTGTWIYLIYRNGQYLGNVPEAEYSDSTLLPSTHYEYAIYALDYHNNPSVATLISITTPAAGGTDPRRVGVRPLGSYWGAAGEKVDVQSGNLNYTAPLIRALGRGGTGVSVALNYNSQQWRSDAGGNWKLGRDVGYGFGWKLMLGALTPFYRPDWTIDHYLFTDSSGAEYRLDVNNGGIWTTHEGIYVYYNPSTNRLYSTDGSFWKFGCTSAGTEPDAGTRYPTLIQDSNGNQIRIRYLAGRGVAWTNSSARISQIEDVRANVLDGSTNQYFDYIFYYTQEDLPHLSWTNNYIGTNEKYTFAYSNSQTLVSPFNGSEYGSTQFLQSVSSTVTNMAGQGVVIGYSFEYSASGEITRTDLPQGGYLRWDYQAQSYAGSISQREVLHQYVSAGSGSEMVYTFGNNPNDSSLPVHAWRTIDYPDNSAQKAWLFHSNPGNSFLGLVYQHEERPAASQPSVRTTVYTWTTGPSSQPYIGTTETTLDPGTTYTKTSKTQQELDGYSNVVHTWLYDFSNLSTPARTYTNSYLSNTNYSSRYILNRLVDSDLVSGSQTIHLATITYDGGTLTNRTGLREHDSANYGTGLVYRGNPTQVVRPVSVGNLSYDITGMVTSSNDGNNHVVNITPDSTRNYAVPAVITPNQETNLQTSQSYNAFLAVTGITYPNGATEGVSYDGYGRVQRVTNTFGGYRSFYYDYGSNWISHEAIGMNADSRWKHTTLDGFGRTIRVQIDTHSGGVESRVDTEYESCGCTPLGKVYRASQPYRPGDTINWTTYSYDSLGRTINVALPGGSGSTTYEYYGNITKVIDPAGKWKKYETDAFGNLVRVLEPDLQSGGNDAPPYVETRYTYNLLNQLVQVEMPRGSSTQYRSYIYDASTRRLTSMTQPETGTTTFSYNADGSLAYKLDAKGQKVAYTYDTYQRITEIKRYKSNGTEDTLQKDTFRYDTFDVSGNWGQNGWGRLTKASWSVSSDLRFIQRYSYLAGGAIAKKQLTINKQGKSRALEATYNFDSDGYLTSMKYPDQFNEIPLYSGNWVTTPGPTFNFTRDGLGRATKMTQLADASTGGVNVDWVYNVILGPAGELQRMKYVIDPTNTATYFDLAQQFNARLQLTRATTTMRVDLNSWVHKDFQYQYSDTQNNGQITKATNMTEGEISYGYDAWGRLTSAVTTGNAYGLSFSYDGFGNRLSQSVTKGSAPAISLNYDPSTNRITTAGYSYDAQTGNLTGMPGNYTMEYDIENRLSKLYYGGNVVEQYNYSPDNLRVWKKFPQQNTEEYYFYGAFGELMDRLDIRYSTYGLNVTSLGKNLYVDGRMIRSDGGAVVTDRLGSVTSKISDTGASASYYPFGGTSSGGMGKTMFATYYRDGNAGLDYARNRYYSNTLGRFLTPDPYQGSANLATPQSWNQYAYVNNDPINFYDPSGLCGFSGYKGSSGPFPNVGPISASDCSEGLNGNDLWEAQANTPWARAYEELARNDQLGGSQVKPNPIDPNYPIITASPSGGSGSITQIDDPLMKKKIKCESDALEGFQSQWKKKFGLSRYTELKPSGDDQLSFVLSTIFGALTGSTSVALFSGITFSSTMVKAMKLYYITMPNEKRDLIYSLADAFGKCEQDYLRSFFSVKPIQTNTSIRYW
jgi:RHS repeat-associated protein